MTAARGAMTCSMLSPLQNGNVAAQVFPNGNPLPGPIKANGNGNVLDQTRFSPELTDPMGLSPVADMNGLLNGIRGLTEADPSAQGQKQQQQQKQPSAEETRNAQKNGQLTPGSNLASKKMLVELDPRELSQMYGELGPLMGELGAARPEVTIPQAHGIHEAFKNDAQAAKPVVQFLGNRRDVKLDETFSSAVGGGTPTLEPSMKDEKSRQMLEMRRDLKPKEMTRMGNRFQFALGDPMMAADAYKSTVPMLAKRKDVHPEYMSSMMDGMMRTMGEPASALRSYKSGTKLMEERPDIQTRDVGQLLNGVANLSKKDGNFNPTRVAGSFEDATNLLREQPGRSIHDVTQLTELIGGPGTAGPAATAKKGQQGGTAGQPARPQPQQPAQALSTGGPSIGGQKDRLGQFDQGLQLMRSAPDLNAPAVHALLTGQSQNRQSAPAMPMQPQQAPVAG